MKTGESKKKKAIIAIVVIAVIIAIFLIFFFFIAPNFLKTDSLPSYQSATVKTGDIKKTVIGSGTIGYGDESDVDIPEGIEIDKVLVESGETVEEGQVLATVDNVSVKTALIKVQDEIKDLDKEIRGLDVDDEGKIKAAYGGRVKAINAKAGDDAAAVTADKGSLMVISTDGYMVAPISDVGALEEKDKVSVTLEDEEEVTGTVITKGGAYYVRVSDNGPEIGENVKIYTKDGELVGQSVLEISDPVYVMGSTGKINDVKVSENDKVGSGDTLFTVSESEDETQKEKLQSQRESLQQEYVKLAALLTSGEITSPFTGVVKNVYVEDDTTVSAQASTSQTTSSQTSSQSTSNAAAAYSQYMGTSANAGAKSNTADGQSGGTVLLSAVYKEVNTSLEQGTQTSAQNTDNANADADPPSGDTPSPQPSSSEPPPSDAPSPQPSPSAAPEQNTANIQALQIPSPTLGAAPVTVINGEGYAGTVSWTPQAAAFEGGTSYTALITLKAANGYVFPTDAVPMVQNAKTQVIKRGDDNTELSLIAVFQPISSGEQQQPDMGNMQGGEYPNMGNYSISPNLYPQGSQSSGMGSISPSISASGTATATETEDSYATAEITCFTIARADTMELKVNIDETDIMSVEQGMEAEVTVDALENETFKAQIKEISNESNSSGGSAKYAATLTVENIENVRSGMNATATITTESLDNVLLLPADAVSENGTEEFVYTEVDGQTGELGGKKIVETGLSDGSYVQITSGLKAGDVVYYTVAAKADELTGMIMGRGMNSGFEGGPPAGGNMDRPPAGNMGGRPDSQGA